MNTFDVLTLVALAVVGIFWVLYVVEAFRQDLRQGLLTLLLPAYVFYFATIKSRRARAWLWLLAATTVLMLLFNTVGAATRGA